MKNIDFQININLADRLPVDFSISFEELVDWNLNKYKPVDIKKEDLLNLNLDELIELEIALIYDHPEFIAGRFKIPFIDGKGNKSEIPCDFMIAKHQKEVTKHRLAFRTPFFYRLNRRQIAKIHEIVVDGMSLICLRKMRQYKEFLRQKKLSNSKQNSSAK